MLLFLDFDGVLHPDRATVDLYFCQLALLEPWLRQRPQIDVVISSSWREAHPLDELREFFSEDLRPRVVSATPVIRNNKGEREAEILCWLRDNGHTGRPWAALDDQAFLFNPNCSSLILCCGTIGLSQAELDRLDSNFLLQGRT
jgi:hypothetical protein